jgi:hypothetical protein
MNPRAGIAAESPLSDHLLNGGRACILSLGCADGDARVADMSAEFNDAPPLLSGR